MSILATGMSPSSREIQSRENHELHCGRGSWGGRRLSLADYVKGTGPRGGRPPPEGAKVAFYEAAGRVNFSCPCLPCSCRCSLLAPSRPISRGSVSLLFALIKDELVSSSAHEGIRRVGAPSTRRPWDSSQATFRAHPPIEPARDLGAHRQSVVDWVHMFTRGSRRRTRRPTAGGSNTLPSRSSA
jgi:hypothetical protein